MDTSDTRARPTEHQNLKPKESALIPPFIEEAWCGLSVEECQRILQERKDQTEGEDQLERFLSDPKSFNQELDIAVSVRDLKRPPSEKSIQGVPGDILGASEDERVLISMRFLIARDFLLEKALAFFWAYANFRRKLCVVDGTTGLSPYLVPMYNFNAGLIEEYIGDASLKRRDVSKCVADDVWNGVCQGHSLSVIGYDREGRPLLYDRMGSTDVTELTEGVDEAAAFAGSSPTNAIVLAQILCAEQFNRLIRYQDEVWGVENKQHVVSSVAICDFAGASRKLMQKKAISLVKACARLNSLIPEALNKLYIINAPAIFTILLTLVRPFIDKRTLSKIEVIPTKLTKERLLEIADAKFIPEHLGGTLCIEDFPELSKVN